MNKLTILKDKPDTLKMAFPDPRSYFLMSDQAVCSDEIATRRVK